MLFSSSEFIFVFLPIVFFGYYLLARFAGKSASGAFLALASLFFYGWWNPAYLPLILISILVNFLIGRQLVKSGDHFNRLLLTGGIVFNFGLLGYFKYLWFVVEATAMVVGSQFKMEPLVLPLAISFFTFQQVAFLVDAYKGEIKSVKFSSYTLFVSFFPQLIAGPIVHHREMMPQFEAEKRLWPGWLNLEQGIRIFLIGLGKKLIIADTLAIFADQGWAGSSELSFWAAWATTLCYTFQLYFDFSGYSDMALGAARFFGIHLPLNFNSPYKARNIQEFWSRWHMTLSRWLKEYLYIPLGGNRRGKFLTWRNLFLTFLLGGIWHGAGWTFIFWGSLHGVGCILHRTWSKWGLKMPACIAWLLTFIYVHIGWVFFRAPSLNEAWDVILTLSGLKGISLPVNGYDVFQDLIRFNWLVSGENMGEVIPFHVVYCLLGAAGIVFMGKNGVEIALNSRLKYPFVNAFFYAALALICLLVSIRATESPFLYFNF